MEELNIDATDISPGIYCNLKGEIKIQGRSLPEDANSVFKPLFDYVEKIESDHIVIDIFLEYMNTSSSKQIYNLLMKLENNDDIDSLIVNWHYEEDDEEHLEAGEIFEEHMEKAKFNYHKHISITTL